LKIKTTKQKEGGGGRMRKKLIKKHNINLVRKVRLNQKERKKEFCYMKADMRILFIFNIKK
jgi:hypothetical protein